MAGQSGDETERASRRPVGDFQKVLIDLGCVCPSVKTAPDLITYRYAREVAENRASKDSRT